jgi:hypothetical protein
MPDTDLKFKDHCPAGTTQRPGTLSSPVVSFTIADTDDCSAEHTNHLFYTVGGTTYNMVHTAEFDTPEEQVQIVLKWREGVTETEITTTPSSNRSQVPNASARETVVTFNAPPLGQAPRDWVVRNGAPGFKLQVKVKRKA